VNTAAIAERSLTKNPWPVAEVSGLTLIQSPLMKEVEKFQHAFTTRLGGNTPAPLNWFNLGRHWTTEESRQDAMINREILSAAMSLDHRTLTVPGQQHTTNIFLLREGDQTALPLPNFDGVATPSANHPILLHFADCVPVMLVDVKQRCLCVMHAGWRGTAGGIVTKGVELLTSVLGCNPADMVAAVGPAIGSCCYETGQEVPDQLAQSVSNPTSLVQLREGKPHPDLKAFNAMQLYEAGVAQVDVTDWCTACHPYLFYSHRQSAGKTGRQGAVACLH